MSTPYEDVRDSLGAAAGLRAKGYGHRASRIGDVASDEAAAEAALDQAQANVDAGANPFAQPVPMSTPTVTFESAPPAQAQAPIRPQAQIQYQPPANSDATPAQPVGGGQQPTMTIDEDGNQIDSEPEPMAQEMIPPAPEDEHVGLKVTLGAAVGFIAGWGANNLWKNRRKSNPRRKRRR